MNHYLLSVHTTPDSACATQSSEQGADMQQAYQKIQVLEEELKSTGAWMASGRLSDPEDATVVRDSGGEILTTDGPFAEAKEHLGGFYIIKAVDLDAALAWASKVTTAVGRPIEVRPFMGLQTD